MSTPGDRVRDRNRPAPDRVGTVLAILDKAATEFHVNETDRSVATDNRGHPTDDPVDGSGEARVRPCGHLAPISQRYDGYDNDQQSVLIDGWRTVPADWEDPYV